MKAILILLKDNVDADKVAEMFRKQGAVEVRVGEFTRERMIERAPEQFVTGKRYNWPATHVK